MPVTFWQYEGKPSPAGTRMVYLWWSSLSILFILISRPCMYASERPFLRARKREGASRAHSPGTAPKTLPQRCVCPAWPLELSRCSPKSICDPSCCRSGQWWTVSIIEDPGLAHDIPLQRVQQVLFDFYALPIYFLSLELLYAVYTNTTSLDLMHHPFQRSWRHTDLLSSSYSGEGGLWDDSFDCLVNGAPPLSKPGLPVQDFRVIDTRMISDLFVRVSATSFILVHIWFCHQSVS